ncbi:MAG: hypothetical protein E6R03_12725 [Hyphomicrobiaceae bacterium]|nr:MAG: hypothetical protein E6R03_12725 [Hyphomicrobiaceae bacterium]
MSTETLRYWRQTKSGEIEWVQAMVNGGTVAFRIEGTPGEDWQYITSLTTFNKIYRPEIDLP